MTITQRDIDFFYACIPAIMQRHTCETLTEVIQSVVPGGCLYHAWLRMAAAGDYSESDAQAIAQAVYACEQEDALAFMPQTAEMAAPETKSIAPVSMMLWIPYRIKFVERDIQPAGYRGKVQEWLKQWTVPNNYSPVLVTADPDDYLPAFKAWANELLKLVRQHFNSSVHPDHDFAADFEISAKRHTAVEGQQACYIGTRSERLSDLRLNDVEDAEGNGE